MNKTDFNNLVQLARDWHNYTIELKGENRGAVIQFRKNDLQVHCYRDRDNHDYRSIDFGKEALGLSVNFDGYAATVNGLRLDELINIKSIIKLYRDFLNSVHKGGDVEITTRR